VAHLHRAVVALVGLSPRATGYANVIYDDGI
jgi:hypothetical protein